MADKLTAPPVHFARMARRCDQCLMDPDKRIVSASRAADILRQTKAADTKFICHKASIAGRDDIACRGHHDAMPCRAYRMAKALGIPVVDYDPETLELVP